MDLQEQLKSMLTEWQPGHAMRTCYDTAWVARLGDIDEEMSKAALQWICDNQLPDGSWGAAAPMYYHDRVISTLAAMLALTHQGRRSQDRKQIELGRAALERFTGGATQGLMADPNGATVGFEMIVPTLIAEAEALGILQRQGDRILGRLTRLRQAKMARLNGFHVSRHLTIAYSAEMAGPDCKFLFDLDNLQEPNGSVAHSPSATAYFARHLRPGDPAAMNYLRDVVAKDGGAPMAVSFDITERSWTLWNLSLTGALDGEIRPLIEPHLDAIHNAWVPGRGLGFGTGYSVADGDDTGLVYAVLTRFGRAVDLDAVYHYEEPNHFRCSELETNPSISANVHLLEALRQAGLDKDHPSVQKIIGFLRQNQEREGYWLDKWHASPYYATAHAAISSMNYDPEMAGAAIRWILNMRHPTGAWGLYMATAEETAYALQALCLWARNGGEVPRWLIKESAAWLADHMEPPYPPLWIAKTLYYSEWIVRSEILSALLLAEDT
jgi:halimadienyl-diphosphate synthase